MFKYIVLIYFVFLSACNIENNYETRTDLSNDEIAKTLNLSNQTEDISKEWFSMFDDKDLNTLLNEAKKSNFTLAQSKEKLLQARYLFLINSNENLPTLDINSQYDFIKSNNSKDFYNNNDYFKAGFDVSWELDLWGKSQNISKQYRELLNKAQYSLADTLISIEGEIINNYVYLRKAQETLRITQKNINLQKEIFDIVHNKYNIGIEDELALNQAEYLLEKTKSSLPNLLSNIENYKNAIAILIGKTPNDLPINLDKTNKNITAKTFKYSVKKLYKIPLDTIRTRPDIKVVEANIKSQNAVLNQAIINLLPSISLEASFSFLSSSGSNLFSTNNQIYGYNPVINIPIWHWNKLTNNVELQKHIKEEYMLNYNEAIITAIMELKNNITNIEQSYKSNTLIKNSLDKMHNILMINKDKYKNGLIDYKTLADSEQNLLETEITYIESNADILKNITSFYKATGGGYNFR